LASDGAFKGYVEIKGEQVKTPVVPKAVAADAAGQIYLLDIASLHVIVLDTAGSVKRTIPLPSDSGFISDIAVDSRGTIFALDSIGFKVLRAAPDKDAFATISSNLNTSLDFPTNIAVDTRGTLYLTDQNGNAIVLLGPDGSFQGRHLSLGWRPGALYYPAQTCVTDTSMVVADRNNNRIQFFTISR
jgi:hypothetical protein